MSFGIPRRSYTTEASQIKKNSHERPTRFSHPPCKQKTFAASLKLCIDCREFRRADFTLR